MTEQQLDMIEKTATIIGNVTIGKNDALWLVDAARKQIRKPVNYIGDGYADGALVYDEAECHSCGYIFDDSCCDWERT